MTPELNHSFALSPPVPGRTGPSDRDRRSIVEAVGSLASVMGIVLAIPFVILLLGLPVVLVLRGIVESIGWLIAVMGG